MDFQLVRGIIVRGRLTDAENKPVRGRVEYFSYPDNPALRSLPDQLAGFVTYRTDPDGRFVAVVLPGPGVLGGIRDDRKRFESPSIRDFGRRPPRGKRNYVMNYGVIVSVDYFSIVEFIRPEPDAADFERDFELR